MKKYSAFVTVIGSLMESFGPDYVSLTSISSIDKTVSVAVLLIRTYMCIPLSLPKFVGPVILSNVILKYNLGSTNLISDSLFLVSISHIRREKTNEFKYTMIKFSKFVIVNSIIKCDVSYVISCSISAIIP